MSRPRKTTPPIAPAFDLGGVGEQPGRRLLRRPRHLRLIIGLVVAGLVGTIVTGGLVTTANAEQAKVDVIIHGDERAGRLGAKAVADDEAQFRASGAVHILDNAYFRSDAWAKYVRGEKSADAAQLRAIKAAVRKTADGYLFPGPRGELLAYTAQVKLSIPTSKRLDLYAEKVAQTQADQGGAAAAAIARQMFSDPAVAASVISAAGADRTAS